MNEWKEVRLGDVCEILDYKRVPLSAIQRAQRQGPYPYYGAQNVIDHVDDYLLDGEYLLVAEDGANLVTRTQNIANFVSGKIWVNNHAHILGYNGKCPLKLLGFIINQSNISPYVTGCAQPKLNQDNLRRISINLPEKVDEIASILSSFDDKIAINRRICENLEAQAQALFKHWFIDFAPFKDGKFVESELGMIPEGWRVGKPYEYLDFIYGAPYKSNLFNADKNGLPLIRIRDLKDCSPQFYTPEILPKSEYVKAGDILAGMDAEFTPYIWKGQQGLLNQRVCKIKPKSKEIGRLFCMLLVKPQLLFTQAVKTGTTVSHIGKSDIDRFKVVLPPLGEVVKFSKLGEEILDEIITISAESSRLASLRDTLLPKLMSGEIKI